MPDPVAPAKPGDKISDIAGATTPAAPAPAHPADVNASVAETLKHLEERTRLAAPQAATPDLDKTVPGGKYIRRGALINAHGREIHPDGTLVHPEEQKIDQFGRLV